MKHLLLSFLLFTSVVAHAQVGIGTDTPAATAQLDVTSTTKGFLPPRMTTADRDAIVSPAAGLIIYNTTINGLQIYSGSTWYTASAATTMGAIGGSSSANGGTITAGVLSLTPSDATNAGIVTTGAQTFAGNKIFDGNVGIGTSNVNASAKLQVDASDKGFLPPRVGLTGTTDVTTIATPATALLVYNFAGAGTAPNNVTPGYYYYAGTKWVPFVQTATFGSAYLAATANVAVDASTNLASITLPTTGTYLINSTMRG